MENIKCTVLITIFVFTNLFALTLPSKQTPEISIIYENRGTIYLYRGHIQEQKVITKQNIPLIQPGQNQHLWGPRVSNNKLAVNVEFLTDQGIANYINIYTIDWNKLKIKQERTIGDNRSTTKLFEFVKDNIYFVSNKDSQYPTTSLFKYNIIEKKTEQISKNSKDVIFCTTNGEKIVYMEWIGPEYSWKNILINLQTKKASQLPVPNNWTYPIISPSGRYIAFLEEAVDSPLSRIVVLDTIGNKLAFQMEKYLQEAIYANFSVDKNKNEKLVVSSSSYGIKIYDLKFRKMTKSFSKELTEYILIANPTIYSENLLLFTAKKKTGEVVIVFFDISRGKILHEINGETYSILK